MKSFSIDPDSAPRTSEHRGLLILKILVHILVVLVVVLLPPLAYDAVTQSRYHGDDFFLFMGGATYPAYCLYWLLKIKNPRVKFVWIHITIVFTIRFFGLLFSDEGRYSLIVVMLPSMVGALPLPLYIVHRLRNNFGFTTTYLISTAIAFPIGLVLSGYIFLSMALSPSLVNFRY